MVASPIHNPDSPESRILIFKRDVTLEQEYQAKYYQAEKMATIGMLAAGVAHEINNPLTAVYGLAEGIRRRLPVIRAAVEDDLYADVSEYTETILMECRRCRDIVRSMLSFSRPHTLAFSPLCLNEVVTDTLSILRSRLDERAKNGLTLTVNLYEDLPTVPGDEAQLKQVLLNILANSMDAIKGEGEITITTHPENDNTVNLSVEDTGCGISPENMDKLFSPFFTTKPVGQGIGINLAACYSIVREHHGVIEVASEVGLGTHFTVKLPLDSGTTRE
jgi:signal transduction histidine kinase